MKTVRKIKIIGAGGFAKELTGYIADNNRMLDENIVIEGYFDINDTGYKKYGYPAPFLGCESQYEFDDKDEVLVAIGDIDIRKKVISSLIEKSVKIGEFIHHSVILDESGKKGTGNIFCPFCIIGPKTDIGSYNLINYQCAIPHDCKLGDMNVFSPNVQLTGFSDVGDGNFFGVSSGTTPSVKIGDNNKIQAGLIISKAIKNNSIVFTMPSVKTMEIYNNGK